MKHETLQFLDQNSLLDNVMYVDMLNEYPLWHGFEWLTLMLKTMSAPISAEERNKHNDFSCFFINPTVIIKDNLIFIIHLPMIVLLS